MPPARSSTPPPKGAAAPGQGAKSPLTPEQEISRLKAKALREQLQRERVATAASNTGKDGASSSVPSAGQKRPYAAISRSGVTPSQRDARNGTNGFDEAAAAARSAYRPLDSIQPAKNFSKYVEYDFSKMTDTKGGFLTAEDDPHNKALHAFDDGTGNERPAHMTLKEWERHQLLKSLREQRAGPYEPGIDAALAGGEAERKCRECGSLEIDWKWLGTLKCAVCNACKDKLPEKYSLLTKTEAREDYLLTDPELKDEELLPHLERPNPHKATWNNMMLFLRYQVEEYAFGKKWGSSEKLDAEFERREADKKKRKDDKFKTKLNELKKRTRVEAYRRSRQAGAGPGGGGGNFGDEVGNGGKHTHVWGRPVENDDGIGVKTCVECAMEVEELEF